jgi:hypothetical protein
VTMNMNLVMYDISCLSGTLGSEVVCYSLNARLIWIRRGPLHAHSTVVEAAKRQLTDECTG